MKKRAKATRTHSAKQDLPARKAGGVKGGSVKSHVKAFDGRTGP